MNLAIKLHKFIERTNILEKPTTKIANCFQTHHNFYKTAILVDHVIRTVVMTVFMMAFPLAIVPCSIYSFGSSLFYRLTVENNCAYKFALPSFAGCVSVMVASQPILDIISGAAFASIKLFAMAVISIAPLGLYITYVVLTVSYDVDKKLGQVCDACN